ncbi:DUF1640 domain-containing protein [Azospirillum sp. RWY-5-1]|uniref:DUF1640 domain-containing protein n=1 Tax=Azospirillum oleiclasticum TaxID=2735135 RepID=A0ABX2TI44_9PROT|nr:coiled-coil domain-containing protein [Azospirillum oleiclasticum]NYZ17291.1 DUF1640 domain-containing protein [Azospirillum oleiclasticum]NYZ23425.1 DUF1640 domain-containing protein [Azospirillum oleiclasticum]
MMAASFDTHAFVKRLTAAGMPEAQAEAVTTMIREARDADLSQMATKADVAQLRSDLRADVSDLKADLMKWLVPLLLGQAALIAALVKLL